MLEHHEIEIRVRYHETDAQGHVHHAAYLDYFELGRTEMLRAAGVGYEAIERDGLRLVVSEVNCRYYLPANFGDVLTLATTVAAAKGARIVHRYRLTRGDDLLAEGETTVASLDETGRVRRLPDWLRKN